MKTLLLPNDTAATTSRSMSGANSNHTHDDTDYTPSTTTSSLIPPGATGTTNDTKTNTTTTHHTNHPSCQNSNDNDNNNNNNNSSSNNGIMNHIQARQLYSIITTGSGVGLEMVSIESVVFKNVYHHHQQGSNVLIGIARRRQ